MLMRAISLRQPWAHAVVHTGKWLENRTWKPNNPNRRFRGELLIHASPSKTDRDRHQYFDYCDVCDRLGLMRAQHKIPFDDMPRGGIIGMVRVTGLITETDDRDQPGARESEWWVGPIALVVKDPSILPFTPCKGMLGFFSIDTDALGLTGAIEQARATRQPA